MLRDALLCIFPSDFFGAYVAAAPPTDVAARLYAHHEPLPIADCAVLHRWFHEPLQRQQRTRFELFDLAHQFQGRDREGFALRVDTAMRFAQTVFWIAQRLRAEVLLLLAPDRSSLLLIADGRAPPVVASFFSVQALRGRPARIIATGDADEEELDAAARFVERWIDLTSWVIMRSQRRPLNCYLMPLRNADTDRHHYEHLSPADRTVRGAVDMHQLLLYLEQGRTEAACAGALRAARHLQALACAVVSAVMALPPSLRRAPPPSPSPPAQPASSSRSKRARSA